MKSYDKLAENFLSMNYFQLQDIWTKMRFIPMNRLVIWIFLNSNLPQLYLCFERLQLKKLAQMGFLGMCKSSKYGRKDFDALGMVIAIEELSRGCASTGVIVSIHNCLYVNFLDTFGTAEQQKKYLDEFTKGKIGCFALSEPSAFLSLFYLFVQIK